MALKYCKVMPTSGSTKSIILLDYYKPRTYNINSSVTSKISERGNRILKCLSKRTRERRKGKT